MSGSPGGHQPTAFERALDGPQKALLRLPWPATARIVLKGSLGFVRQMLRSRRLGRRRSKQASTSPSV